MISTAVPTTRSRGVLRLVVPLLLLLGLSPAAQAVDSSQAAMHGDPGRVAMSASAASAVTVTVRNVASYRERCVRQTVVVAARHDASTSGTWSGQWSADVAIDDPDGRYAFSDSYSGTARSKTFSFTLCGEYDRPGLYRVQVLWEQYDADYISVATGEARTGFRYSLQPKAASRLVVGKAPYGSTGWRFTGRLTRTGSPYARQPVELWVRINGVWMDFEETKRTAKNGRLVWRTAQSIPRNPYRFQLRYAGNDVTKGARSKVFTLQRR